jgi:hypothetical protein
MKNDAIIDSILCLLKEYKSEAVKIQTSKRKTKLKSLKYLISQSIRQYDVPERHRHLSKKAYARWNQLTTDDIMAKHHNDKVDCDRLTDAVREYQLFTGAKNAGEPSEISEDGFKFGKMFHEDHVIPVSLIFGELTKKNNFKRKEMKHLLNKMHTCIVLKEEDRRLGRTKGRSLSYKATIENVYQKRHVDLLF